MKEQDKTPEEELNKMETSHLPNAEFKTLVITMLNKLRGRRGGQSMLVKLVHSPAGHSFVRERAVVWSLGTF